MRHRLLFILCLISVMTGCTYNMALTKWQTDLDVTTKSIALLSVSISALPYIRCVSQ